MSLFRTKSLEKMLASVEGGASGMKRTLGAGNLIALGVGAIIGAGLFVRTAAAASEAAGPAVTLSFLVAAVGCAFAGLCYAEFASMIPIAGSAYAYSYVTMGELVAWIIGWALIMEYAIGNVVVAISWSSYFNNVLAAFGMHLPDWMTMGWQTAHFQYEDALSKGASVTDLAYSHAPSVLGVPIVFNLPAFLIVVVITWLVYIGIKESKKTANAMVMLKILILIMVAAIGFWYIFSHDTLANWTPFMPNGISGVLKGVSAVFFAYIGFDAISTTAEECANPQTDLPKGMIYSLLICTLIYVVTALVITGMVNYKEFEGISDPLAYVFDKIDMKKVGFIISISAVVAATSVLLVFQLGQPRIWMAMSRDGLLPKSFGRIHPKFQTPAYATVWTGIFVGSIVLVADDKLMTDLTSIGTLFAFLLVSGGVLLLPKVSKEPGKFNLPYINGRWIVPALLVFALLFEQTRTRIVEAVLNLATEDHQEVLFLVFVILAAVLAVLTFLRKYSLVPVIGVLCCLYLLIEIPVKSWVVFFVWMLIGLTIYFLFGYRNSKLANKGR